MYQFGFINANYHDLLLLCISVRLLDNYKSREIHGIIYFSLKEISGMIYFSLKARVFLWCFCKLMWKKSYL